MDIEAIREVKKVLFDGRSIFHDGDDLDMSRSDGVGALILSIAKAACCQRSID